MAALVVLAPPDGPIEPGAEAESVVLVRNTGEQVDDFDVVVQGPASAWAAVEPRSLRLAPGEEAPAWVRFSPPRATSTSPGPTPFAVVVASRLDPSFAAIEEGSVEVTRFNAVRCALDLAPSTERGWTEFVLAIDNDGNATTRVEIDVVKAPDGATVQLDLDELEILPGAWTAIPVRVRTRRGRRGPPVLGLRVTSDGSSVHHVEAVVERESSLAADLRRSAVLLAVVLAGLAMGFIALTRGGAGDDGEAPAALRTAPPATAVPEEEEPAEATAAPQAPAPTVAATPTAGRAPADIGRLVFVRHYGEEKDIVVRSPGDADAEVRLRAEGTDERRPVLSPDGLKVAYLRLRGAEARVCVIAVTGGESTCVAESSPSGAVAWKGEDRLLFSREGVLYEVAADGAGEPRELGVRVNAGRFVLSPDGTRVAFVDGGIIAVRPLDGSQGLDLDVAGTPEDPSWSPDGSRIVYTESYQIRITPVGTGAVRTLTGGSTVNGDPYWSRDGKWVVFRSNRSGNGDLYAVDTTRDGAEPDLRRITDAPERDANPAF